MCVKGLPISFATLLFFQYRIIFVKRFAKKDLMNINQNPILIRKTYYVIMCDVVHIIIDRAKANCPFLVAPRVNPEIWNLMNVYILYGDGFNVLLA